MKQIALFFVLMFWVVSAKAIEVAATYPPIHSLVSAVTLNVTQPVLIIQDSGGSHHEHALKTGEAKRIAKADVIFWVGPEFEAFMPEAFQNIAKKKAVSVPLMTDTKDLKILPSARGEKINDVHIWLDPDNTRKMVDKIAAVLGEADPKNKEKYVKNAEKFNTRIETLENYKVQQKTPMPTVVSLHDGYAYLFAYMGLTGSQSIAVDGDYLSGPKTMQKAKDTLKALNPTCVVVAPGTKKRTIEALTGNKYKLIYMEPMSWYLKSNPGLYMTSMVRAMRNIQDCLGLQK